MYIEISCLHPRDINGYRISDSLTDLVIQDLHTGGYVKLRLRRDLGAEPTLAGDPQVLAALTSHLPELSNYLAGASDGHAITVSEVAAAITRSARDTRPAFPIPTVAVVEAFALPFPGARPIGPSVEYDIASVLLVATALSWRGGFAKDFELEADLIDVVQDRNEARMARDIARRRSGSNIALAGKGEHAMWLMSPYWTR